jgi:hypothetical protein
VSSSYFPVGAAEFPNDNPGLHRGARWVCRTTLGHARALLRPGLAASPEPSGTAASASNDAGRPLSGPASVEAADPVVRALRLKGPLEIVLGRVILLHRVENVPPPPDFIFEPFVRSPLPEPSLAAAAVADAGRIEPRPCRVIDDRNAAQRVDRGSRVDIAPCVDIGVSASARAAPTGPKQAVRRAKRSRGRLAARALAPSRRGDEVSRAIIELDTAFAQPELHSAPDESTGVTACRIRGV